MGGNLLMEELALPVEGLFLDRINVADQEDAEERQHAGENQAATFEEHFRIFILFAMALLLLEWILRITVYKSIV